MQINLNLDEQELQYTLEALLFACCSDVCGDWYKEDISKFLQIIKKIKQDHPTLLPTNVFIHNPTLSNEIQSVDNHTPDIIKLFPNILKENII